MSPRKKEIVGGKKGRDVTDRGGRENERAKRGLDEGEFRGVGP